MSESIKSQSNIRIALFGTDSLGRWLLEKLIDIHTKISFIVDHTYLQDNNAISFVKRLKRLVKYPVMRILSFFNLYPKIPLLNIFDRWPGIDLLVVSPFADFEVYEDILRCKVKERCRIIPITEFIE